MARYELLVKVGDGGASRDGDVIAAKPAGEFYDIAALESGAAPQAFLDAYADPVIRAKAQKAGGIDSNWGFKDLANHAVIEATLTETELAELLETPEEPGQGKRVRRIDWRQMEPPERHRPIESRGTPVLPERAQGDPPVVVRLSAQAAE